MSKRSFSAVLSALSAFAALGLSVTTASAAPVQSIADTAPVQSIADTAPVQSIADTAPVQSIADTASNSFTFYFDSNEGSDEISTHSIGAGSCTGNFSDPQLEAGNTIGYGIHVTCAGTGYLPLVVDIELQEEHLGFFYNTVDSTTVQLHNGYGFVRGEAYCNHDAAGHDYRVSAVIRAGEHTGTGLSREVHLPCNL